MTRAQPRYMHTIRFGYAPASIRKAVIGDLQGGIDDRQALGYLIGVDAQGRCDKDPIPLDKGLETLLAQVPADGRHRTQL